MGGSGRRSSFIPRPLICRKQRKHIPLVLVEVFGPFQADRAFNSWRNFSVGEWLNDFAAEFLLDMASIRIFVPTFRRSGLLHRALSSLRAQTFTDWTCEVHNDDPSDPEPERVVHSFGDERVMYLRHAENLGPTKTFNQFFAGAAEPYLSILEDDNWWEPMFLETLRGFLERRPDVSCVWSNMRVWQEHSDGSWQQTEETTWPVSEGEQVFAWPQPRQWCGALHSQGAMIVRTRDAAAYRVPDNTPIAAVEMVRERRIRYPIALWQHPLANFARTLQTARGGATEWGAMQVLLASSFLRYAAKREGGMGLDDLWRQARSRRPSSSNVLLLAALGERGGCEIWRGATAQERWALLASSVRHPLRLLRLLRARRHYPEVWAFLQGDPTQG